MNSIKEKSEIDLHLNIFIAIEISSMFAMHENGSWIQWTTTPSPSAETSFHSISNTESNENLQSYRKKSQTQWRC